MTIPHTFSRDELNYANAERSACQAVANMRGTETVALYAAGGEPGDWRFRTLVFGEEQHAATELVSDADPVAAVAERLTQAGENLVTVF